MRLNRFALVAGVLALGAAACGDDVQVVEPTPPVPPPPPPVEASMAPSSASVAVGSNVVFAVTASGGVSGEAANWTCASSNTGIATVSVTSAGCQATGVAAGSVTITAAVSKSGETVNVGAELTVTSDAEPPQPPGDPAFVLIQGFSSDIDDANKVRGTVNVTVSVDRGSQTLSQVGIAVDGEIVSYQSFGGTMTAPADDEPAEQAGGAIFTLSFESDAYDVATGAPSYMNGDHVLTAGILVEGSMEPILSNSVPLVFDNIDGVHVMASPPGDGVMNTTTGHIWYGGPNAGAFEITALPVMYSGGSVESVTLLAFCGAKAITDDTAPYAFEPGCKSSPPAGDTPGFTVASGGQSTSVDPLNDDHPFPIRLDYDGPSAPMFVPNPNLRQDGWINADVQLVAKYENKDGKRDGWLLYGKDAGVGGYVPQLRYGENITLALAADPSSEPALPAPTKKDVLCFVASAVDLLGNESRLPSAEDGCAAIPEGGIFEEDGMKIAEDEDDEIIADLFSTIRAGVDTSAPTLIFTGRSPKENTRARASNKSTNFREFEMEVVDTGGSTGKSGLHRSMPVLAKVERRDADDTACSGDGLPGEEDVTTDSCVSNGDGFGDITDDLILTTAFADQDDIGYYTFTAMSQDKAGNRSDQISRTVLLDTEQPGANVNAPGSVIGSFDAGVSMSDDLSIRDYRVSGIYTDTNNNVFPAANATSDGDITLRLGITGAVDAYNAPELTQSTRQDVKVNTFLILQGTNASAAVIAADVPADATARTALGRDFTDALTSVEVYLRDQGSNSDRDTDDVDVEDNEDVLANQVFNSSHACDLTADPVTCIITAVADGTLTAGVTVSIPKPADAAADATQEVKDNVAKNQEAWDAVKAAYERNHIATFANATTVAAGTDRSKTITLTATVTGVSPDNFANQFDRVDFYAARQEDATVLVKIASVPGFDGEPADIDVGGTDIRGLEYEVEINAGDYYGMLTTSTYRGDYAGNLYAVGVSLKGRVALVSQLGAVAIAR
ncbi:MAG: Ig-like domain-containing protein [Gammaproteobacteria bacterium]|nr:Ig-like domain-containing protein [Gammaproteobacteria bacterium]MDE0247787.1 Ig-like domain-containing protein [Gammaproteobacteria bacterium]